MRLRLRVPKQRFFFRHVQARSYAAVVPRIDQVKTFLQRLHGAIKNSNFTVQLPQRKIISRQFRGDHQPHVFKIRGAGLISGFGRFDAAAALSEKIHFVTDHEGKRGGILVHRPWVIGDPAAGRFPESRCRSIVGVVPGCKPTVGNNVEI